MGSAVEIVARACASGLDLDTRTPRILAALRRRVPVDAVFWAIADPATLLFTRSLAEDIPPDAQQAFAQNEFMGDDVNKFMHVSATSAVTLAGATAGELERSERYRTIIEPLGWGDELRAAFRDAAGVWGFMCLHRAGDQPVFSDEEIRFVDAASPHIAKAIRTSVLLGAVVAEESTPDAPGLVLLSPELDLIGTNDSGERWLEVLGMPRGPGGLPNEILVLAAAARGIPSSEFAHVPRIRVQTVTGGWAVLHASVVNVGSTEQVAVVIEPATPIDLAPLIVASYGLTNQERRIVELVCHGASTRDIAAELFITANTIQDHLKSVFAKTGTGSRRELVATLMSRDYMPRAKARDPLDRKGQFTK
jgi:DNA-binding CsgD family transcriptional regulator